MIIPEKYRDLSLRLFKHFARISEESPAKLGNHLAAYLQDVFQCSRYLCIYYNTDRKTNLEFNLLPTDRHVPQPPPLDKTCFRSAATTPTMHTCVSDEKKCGSQRCSPPAPTFPDGHNEGLRNLIAERWPEQRESLDKSLPPFWLDYELFLHQKFDPFSDGAEPKSAAETTLFKILLEQQEQNDFFKKYRIFKGNDELFNGNFSLKTFNERNTLDTNFYGCYLIPPTGTNHASHAALLLAYVKDFYPDEHASEKAAALLGFLSQICWPTLNREIVYDMEKLREEKEAGARHEATAKAMEHSHKKLMLLQRPLDALTKAFGAVQAEAQEMQSILNDPETVLFNSHKLLSDLFTLHCEIRLSDSITLRCEHSWTSSTTTDQKRMAYAYALCRIFGKERELSSCQTVDAVEAVAQQALREVQGRGVHEKLLGLVCQLLLHNNDVFMLIDSLRVLPCDYAGSSNTIEMAMLNAATRKANALDLVFKPVVFTPFKSFGSQWPVIAFEVAFMGEGFQHRKIPNLRNDSGLYLLNHVEASKTPFPQHAVLSFIINMRALSQSRKKWIDISYLDSKDLVEVRLKYSGSRVYVYEYATEKRSSLHAYIRHAVKYRSELGNSGDFLNIFGSLLRKGLGIVLDKPKVGDWELLYCEAPENEMLVLGRVAKLDKTEYESYFQIYQEHIDEGDEYGFIALRWSSTLAILKGSKQVEPNDCTMTEGHTAAIHGVESEEYEVSRKTLIKCALLDHNEGRTNFRETLSNALNGFGELVGAMPEIPDNTRVLFLHRNADVEDTIGDFLRDRIDRYVVLISTTGDPHPYDRDRFYTRWNGKVRPLLNEHYKFDSSRVKKMIKEMLGSLT